MKSIPRHVLIPEILRGQAYRDQALPIGEGQTISAPGVVARMTQALRLEGTERILEIGTGSGYQAAVLSHLVESVISIERIPHLAAAARGQLDRMGISNVTVFLGDGTWGRTESGPYDGVLVTAGGPTPPEPILLQLRVGGALVGPFGPRDRQRLLRIVRRDRTHFVQEVLGDCNFVDLIGEHGWAA
jgi:protein-L-isoaspartate(D-aspartate) O-methyltransferase